VPTDSTEDVLEDKTSVLYAELILADSDHNKVNINIYFFIESLSKGREEQLCKCRNLGDCLLW
jgi:hypothetical protein